MDSNANFQISDKATIHESVVFGPNCHSIKIGHGTQIHRDVYIDVDNLEIGDYVTIHHGTVVHGETIRIGHNCWVGHYCILDGHGGFLSIGNNVGVGAQSQLWSHISFGDTLAGCRFKSHDSLVIEDDVWFVGHCIVTPIVAKEKSMLMVGSTVTKDMEANHVYAGSPASDRTDVFGTQFSNTSDAQRVEAFLELVKQYGEQGGDTDFIQVWECLSAPEEAQDGRTIFSPARRRYIPTYSEQETRFMRFLLYDKAKFIPCSEID